MTVPFVIRRFAPHEWENYKKVRLRALADSPDAFGSTLAAEQDRSDTDWARRLELAVDTCWNLPLLAEAGAQTIGLAWGRIDPSKPDVANLYQMWVAPSHRRFGVGRMLLEAVIAWARTARVQYVDLGVTCGDSSAMRLYRRAGFKPLRDAEPLRPGSSLLSQPMRLAL